MKAQEFLFRDSCRVCGQTPCNCTHVTETALAPGNVKTDTEARRRALQDLTAKRQALADLERQFGADQEAIRQRKLDLEKEARVKGLVEFAPTRQGGGGDDYIKALASAWYNDTFNTGSLQRGIKSQEDVERILERGVICNDGKRRKYSIGYNANYDGVELTSDDYYEYDDGSGKIDSRTNKPWGPYERIEFHDSQLDEDLRKWFKEKWVRFGPDGKIRGDCARGDDSEGKPKCLPQAKAHALGKKGRASAAARKRREDPNPERRGAAKNVATKKKSNEGVAEGVYSVSAFKVDAYESMSDFRKWMRSPKNNERGMTRHIVDIYENIIVNDDLLTESSQTFIKRKQQAKAFSDNFKQFDDSDKVQIKLGNKIALLSSTVIPDDKSSKIELSGFTTPKKIVKINLDNSGKIDSIKFDDGSIFPEASEFTTVGGVNITNTIFFPDSGSASKAYTAIWMYISNLEGKGWKIENYMSEGVAEGTKQQKDQDIEEQHQQCPECGGPMFPALILGEKQDACYYKVKSRYKVWPSAYASGALVQCRKKGAKNWGNKE